jgi:predicted membrane-bound spermidine synthase
MGGAGLAARGSVRWLGAALLLSGAAALVFEALWFRLAGLLLGNSVWGTTIVLASFMAGLALGNGWAAGRLGRFRDPIRTYAAVEAAIGLSGVALVLALPALNGPLGPMLAPFLDRPLALNLLRGAAAFALLVVPATAMGVTLPLAVKALAARDTNFGRVLGRLYGLNTLGGVAGVLACEFALVPAIGLRLSGVTAGVLNLAAAACALRLRRTAADREPAIIAVAPAGLLPPRLLAAAAVAGGALLALEVVWFRLLLLFLFGSSAHFAIMLATVLLGISGGGLGASLWLARRPDDHRFAAHLACATGAATVLAYIAYATVGGSAYFDALPWAVTASLTLMLPTSLLSGALFTVLGRAVQARAPEAARVTARLTLANTLGAMAGALAGGLFLIPALGAEATLFALAAAYGVVAILSWPERSEGPATASWPALAALGTLAALLVAFPFGRMSRLLERVRGNQEPDLVLVAAREGRSETVQYTRRELFGRPMYYRLLTNGISMSGTNFAGQRYMGTYVYWPMALHPRAQDALLLSYGVGVTARALVETRSLRSIDVVDVSREILSLSHIPFGVEGDPLRDPRVRVHVEDARFFLQSTDRAFDLITGEPPPPKAAGIVTLYSREYFALLRSRLAPQGLTTYWLPVQQMEPREARAIVAAFCEVFADCTLWTGAGPEWMLAGSRDGGPPPPSAEEFGAQWRDPVLQARLRDVALEFPGDLSGLFLGDSTFLADYVRGVPPLTDDRPHRLGNRVRHVLHPDFVSTMDAQRARERFRTSEWVAHRWPEALQADADAAFREQSGVNAHLLAAAQPGWRPDFALLHRLLSATLRQGTPRLLLGVSADAERIAVDVEAGGSRDPDLDYLLGVRALCMRDYAAAADRFGRRLQALPRDGRTARCLILSLVLGGDRERAAATARELRAAEPDDRAFWSWLDGALAG